MNDHHQIFTISFHEQTSKTPKPKSPKKKKSLTTIIINNTLYHEFVSIYKNSQNAQNKIEKRKKGKKKKSLKRKSVQKRGSYPRITIIIPTTGQKTRIETLFDLAIAIDIFTAIVHRSNKNQLIFQVPLQEAHLFSLAGQPRSSAVAAPLLAPPEPIVVLRIVGDLPLVTTTAATAEAEAELGGAEEREGCAEEREEDRRAEEEEEVADPAAPEPRGGGGSGGGGG
ncbi:hypothetical protein PanWU01x14_356050 [Parasponia andersonii]|uniref:Uncharacterized protein n=1 Tax=Parasponia andersonii TaxID=3476 RepID=A0A2P5A918_PARAD|nr:hypothetical protein PanWU01x14_356050 [Parasponia andersonii]